MTSTGLKLHLEYQIRSSVQMARTRVDSVDAVCITLNKYAYPTRYGDMIKNFTLSVPQLCFTFNHITDFLYESFNYLFRTLDQN